MKVRDNPSDVLEHKGRERRYLQKNTKIITGSIVALAVIVVLGIVYAAFTQQLTINGSATGRSSSWKIYFSRLTGPTLNGTAKQLTAPTIQNNATKIGDYSVTVTSPGDYVEYEFDVTNDGDYDATLTNLSMNSNTELTYEGSGDNEVNDENNVKSQIEYTLKYSDGTTVAEDDTLKSKETKTMRLRLTYKSFNDATLLPKADVAISGLGISLTYTQDGNAKVNNDGTTPLITYTAYSKGNQITVANEQYYVIADSGITQDYVTALKAEPLTYSEMSTLLESTEIASQIASRNSGNTGYLYSAYLYSDTCKSGGDISGCSSDYDVSSIKKVVNVWANNKFTDQLKIVDGYSARLINTTELEGLGYVKNGTYYPANVNVPSWVYNNYYHYWTMSPWIDSNNEVSSSWAFYMCNDGYLYAGGLSDGSLVRPVINVYKSKISS